VRSISSVILFIMECEWKYLASCSCRRILIHHLRCSYSWHKHTVDQVGMALRRHCVSLLWVGTAALAHITYLRGRSTSYGI